MKTLINLLLNFSCFLLLLPSTLTARESHHCCPKILGDYEKCNYAYFGATGSMAFHNDLDGNLRDTFKSDVDFKTGYGFGLSVGYAMPKYYLRTELEMLYRRHSVDCVKTNAAAYGQGAAGRFGASGYSRDLALLANLIFEVPVTQCVGIYAGGGVGISFNQIELDRVNNITYPGFAIAGYESQQNHDLFAWNVQAGFTYSIVESIILSAGYRLFGTSTISFNDAAGFSRTNVPLQHSVDIGLKFKM